jgi:hypothetical protein
MQSRAAREIAPGPAAKLAPAQPASRLVNVSSTNVLAKAQITDNSRAARKLFE